MITGALTGSIYQEYSFTRRYAPRHESVVWSVVGAFRGEEPVSVNPRGKGEKIAYQNGWPDDTSPLGKEELFDD